MQKPKDLIIIEFEGPDKVGKQTQSKMFAKYLNDNDNYHVGLFEVPDKSFQTGMQIYSWLKNKMASKYPEAFQMLQTANRLSLQEELSDFTQLYGNLNIVIFDRWIGSTYAYGRASGLTKEFIDDITSPIWKPDATFILFGDPHVDPDENDEYETNKEFQKRVREGYLEWVRGAPQNKYLIDANRTKEIVFEDIVEKFKEYINV